MHWRIILFYYVSWINKYTFSSWDLGLCRLQRLRKADIWLWGTCLQNINFYSFHEIYVSYVFIFPFFPVSNIKKNSDTENTNRDDKNSSNPNFLMLTIINLILRSNYWSAKLSQEIYVTFLIKIQKPFCRSWCRISFEITTQILVNTNKLTYGKA